MNEELLKFVKSREEKQTEFNGGILTADRYVKTLEECVGSNLCYRYGAKGNVSFDDVKKRASKTLTYNNPDMIVKDIYVDWKSRFKDTDLVLPKNTLMVFKHVLTTPKKDRDGDILRTQGAVVDPKMLMLWQHVHTLPIGKMLLVSSHTSKELVLVSAIVDMNELSHDAAVMIDNDMGRFSHGFKALEFKALKETEGETTGGSGFDVKRFEVMEESVVSVPSNTDADVQEIMLDLIESDKLSSSMMKAYGKTIRSVRPKQFDTGGGKLDLNVTVEVKDARTPEDKSGAQDDDCSCGGAGSSKETHAKGGDHEEDHADDKKMMCPECGIKLEDGTCPECGYKYSKEKEDDKTVDMSKTVELEEKSYVDGTMVNGSFEWVSDKLRKQAKDVLQGSEPEDYCWLVATKMDSTIIGYEKKGSYGDPTYYKMTWNGDLSSPQVTGDMKEVSLNHNLAIIEKARIDSAKKDLQIGRLDDESRKKIYEAIKDQMGDASEHGEKAGRVLSRANQKVLKEVAEDLKEIHDCCSTRSGKALCSKCSKSIMGILENAGMEDDDEGKTVEQIAADFIVKADETQRDKLYVALQALKSVSSMKDETRKIKEAIASN